MTPLSPSNLNMFATCPRKFQAQYVTKEIVAKFDSPAATRGIILHGLLESSVKNGHTRETQEIRVNKNKRLVSWADYPTEEARCLPAIERFASLKDQGWAVKVEFEAAVGQEGEPCDWWDKECFARAKIDVLFVPPNREGVFIWDWKTGKKTSINPIQMPFTALLLACYFGSMTFSTADFMIDSEDIIQETFNPEADLLGMIECAGPVVFDHTIVTIRDMRRAYEFDQWPARRNRLCNWCEIKARCSAGK